MRIINHLAVLFAKSQKQESRYRLKKKMDFIIAKKSTLLVLCVYYVRIFGFTIQQQFTCMANLLSKGKLLILHSTLTQVCNAQCSEISFHELCFNQNVTFWRVTRYGFAKNCAKTTNNSRLGDFCEKTHLVHNSKIHNLHLIAGLFLAKPIWQLTKL